MIKFNSKKILIPYDFSKTAAKALTHGAVIAACTKGDLYLLHVQKKSELLDIILPALKLKNNKQILDFVMEKLSKLANDISKKYGIKVTPLVSTGNITGEIVAIAEEYNIDIIVMGTQGQDSKSDLFLGSTAYRLVTKAPMPVMTVKEFVNLKGYKNILLPIDLTRHSRQKVNYAIGLAQSFGAKITVLGLYDENEKDDKFKLQVITEQIEKLCKKSKVRVECFVDKTRHRVSKTNSFAKKHKCDLIITMTNQKIETNKSILSSYNHELVHTAKIPVISIEPEINPDYVNNPTGLPF